MAESIICFFHIRNTRSIRFSFVIFICIAEGVIPQKYRMDGLHIALAAVNGLDMIISMNFQHIIKRKTIKMTGYINTMNGYHAIEIYSPMEDVENENA